MAKTLLTTMASNLPIEGLCPICQYAKLKNTATISCCKHTFHLDCIKTWSQITNKCPFCKLRFTYITSLQTHQLIPVENREQKLQRDDLSYDMLGNDQYWDNQACEVCKSTDPSTDEYAVICDSCDKIYHTFCIGLATVPSETNWFCSQCVQPAVYKDDLSDFDVNDELPDNVFSVKKHHSSDDEEWKPVSHCNKSRNDNNDFGVMEKSKNKRKRRRKVMEKEGIDDVIDCQYLNGNGVKKRRKVRDLLGCYNFHSDPLNGDYYGYSTKQEGVVVVDNKMGGKMWSFTFKKKKKKK